MRDCNNCGNYSYGPLCDGCLVEEEHQNDLTPVFAVGDEVRLKRGSNLTYRVDSISFCYVLISKSGETTQVALEESILAKDIAPEWHECSADEARRKHAEGMLVRQPFWGSWLCNGQVEHPKEMNQVSALICLVNSRETARWEWSPVPPHSLT